MAIKDSMLVMLGCTNRKSSIPGRNHRSSRSGYNSKYVPAAIFVCFWWSNSSTIPSIRYVTYAQYHRFNIIISNVATELKNLNLSSLPSVYSLSATERRNWSNTHTWRNTWTNLSLLPSRVWRVVNQVMLWSSSWSDDDGETYETIPSNNVALMKSLRADEPTVVIRPYPRIRTFFATWTTWKTEPRDVFCACWWLDDIISIIKCRLSCVQFSLQPTGH